MLAIVAKVLASSHPGACLRCVIYIIQRLCGGVTFFKVWKLFSPRQAGPCPRYGDDRGAASDKTTATDRTR